jgi:hypothetical protein
MLCQCRVCSTWRLLSYTLCWRPGKWNSWHDTSRPHDTWWSRTRPSAWAEHSPSRRRLIPTRSTRTGIVDWSQSGFRSCMIMLTDIPAWSVARIPQPRFLTYTLLSWRPSNSGGQGFRPTGGSDCLFYTEFGSPAFPNRHHLPVILDCPDFKRMGWDAF